MESKFEKFLNFPEKQYLSSRPKGFATKAIHAGQEPDKIHGAINVPIYLSTTFK